MCRGFIVLICLFSIWPSSGTFCQTWADPEDPSLPPDFFIMGEYFGNFDDGEKLGAHVRSNGKNYDVHFTRGGLPGPPSWPMGGWDGQWKSPILGKQFSGNTMTLSGGGWSATLTVKGDVDNARNIPDKDKIIEGSFQGRAFKLHRVKRTPPSLNLKPLPGAEVLFDGSKESFDKNWKITADGKYDAERKAIYRGVTSKNSFNQQYLHLELLGPFEPTHKNQKRANSGVYFQRRYETQIMDSFGENGLKNDAKGGLYGNKPPLINATLPPLSWETYDVIFSPAEFSGSKKTKNCFFTVWLNGIRVQDNTEMEGSGTGGAREGPSAGPLFLQNHGGDPVYFRNIWTLTDLEKIKAIDTNLFVSKAPDPTDIAEVRPASAGFRMAGLEISITLPGVHRISVSDCRGNILFSRSGRGENTYRLTDVKKKGIVLVNISTAGGSTIRKLALY